MVWRAEYFLSPLLLTTVWGSLVVFPVTVQVTEMWPFIEPFFLGIGVRRGRGAGRSLHSELQGWELAMILLFRGFQVGQLNIAFFPDCVLFLVHGNR